ncbi:MAG: hypothetical protein AAGG80_03810, partial [Pseudomonadota bacterium]
SKLMKAQSVHKQIQSELTQLLKQQRELNVEALNIILMRENQMHRGVEALQYFRGTWVKRQEALLKPEEAESTPTSKEEKSILRLLKSKDPWRMMDD